MSMKKWNQGWVRGWIKGALLLPALCLASPSLFARPHQQDSSQQQATDPVAEAARKARENKKNAPKPKKVFTEDDIATKPASSSGEAAAASQSVGGIQQAAPVATAAAGSEPKNDEAGWRQRFEVARGKITGAEKQLDVMQRELDKSQIQYYSDPQKAMEEQNSRKDINDKTAKIDAQKQQIVTLKQELSELEDELRKAGGDPGWARE